ncbi:hypothetical protein ITJ57_19045 [Plantibacter sp. VKM Ac-2880]|uniref:hypothetical protein n=1 Tax=Plantibacter sp. VKM Ac-2880 TaxID=2783827 RepID=UPI0018906EFF|nr:hypothetical protein [Plantibacter sp. VKM Ac-2880]MBF4570870.1 hypothetical protein [Plantibacter sp. VKM Ac-2880]
MSAPDVAGMRSTVLVEEPEGYELAALRGRGRVDGNLVGTAVFRPTATSTVEAEGRDYLSARATLDGLVTADQIVLSLRVVD